jgi:GTP-binding protein HflX
VTRDVLKEIEAADSPSLLILNKVDCLDASTIAALKIEFPDAVMLSAKRKDDVKWLRERIIEHFEKDMKEEKLLVPYEKSAILGELRQALRVLSESHDEIGTTFVVRGYAEQILRIAKKLS